MPSLPSLPKIPLVGDLLPSNPFSDTKAKEAQHLLDGENDPIPAHLLEPGLAQKDMMQGTLDGFSILMMALSFIPFGMTPVFLIVGLGFGWILAAMLSDKIDKKAQELNDTSQIPWSQLFPNSDIPLTRREATTGTEREEEREREIERERERRARERIDERAAPLHTEVPAAVPRPIS
jgi:hypothetical protein